MCTTLSNASVCTTSVDQIPDVLRKLEEEAEGEAKVAASGQLGQWLRMGRFGRIGMLEGLLQVTPVNPKWHLLDRYNHLMEELMQIQGCIGTAQQLFGVELIDTNRLLLALCPMPITLIAQHDEALTQMVTVIKDQFHEFLDLVFILNVQLASSLPHQLIHFPHNTTHPQLPLRFDAITEKLEKAGVLSMSAEDVDKHGFVGFAANLLVMPNPNMRLTSVFKPEEVATAQLVLEAATTFTAAAECLSHATQLGEDVAYPDVSKALTISDAATRTATAVISDTFSMRQTVAYMLMQDVMVFRNIDFMSAFTNRCAAAGVLMSEKLVALDGHCVNLEGPGWSSQLSLRDEDASLLFCPVPEQLQAVSPMDMRLCGRQVGTYIHLGII